jgi:hypothetical protein
VLDQGSRLRTLIKNLGLAFINAASTAHWDVPCVVEIHEVGVLRMPRGTTHDGAAVKARDKENKTRTQPGIEPIRLAYPVQSILPSGPEFYRD